MIDFKEIPHANLNDGSQDTFELFAQAFLSKFYTIVQIPNRGSDGGTGKDLIIEETFGPDQSGKLRWLVSCKHYAHSGKSVMPGDESNIRDRVEANNCHGFMGFYSTIVSTGLGTILAGLQKKIQVYVFTPPIIEVLLKDKDLDVVFGTYFERSYAHWCELQSKQLESKDLANFKSFERVRQLNGNGSNADRFYDGFSPSWEDLSSENDIPRDVYVRPGGIRDTLGKLTKEKSTDAKLISIYGVGGSGKSTLLKRIAFDLSSSFENIFYLKSDWRCDQIPIQDQIKSLCELYRENVFILIDDFSQLIIDNTVNLKALGELNLGKNNFVILCDHPNRLHHLQQTSQAHWDEQNKFDFYLHQLSNNECAILSDKIDELERDNKLTSRHRTLTKEERLNLCIEDSNRHFVVAMLQIRYGKNFKNIIIDEYSGLFSESIKKAYECICLFDKINAHLPESILLRSSFVDEYQGSKEVQKHLIHAVIFNREGYSARHRIISREVFNHVFGSPRIIFLALKSVFGSLEVESIESQKFVTSFFSINEIHKRIIGILKKDQQLILDFLSILQMEILKFDSKYHVQFFIYKGLTERTLNDNESALDSFKCVLEKYDKKHSFSCRQIAWIYHDLGKWGKAAKWAMRSANYAPELVKVQLQCAKILSLNTMENFKLAEKFYLRAKELDEHDEQTVAQIESYQNSKAMLSYFSSAYEDELVPEDVLKVLRPGLSFFRNYYGIESFNYKSKVKSELTKMEGRTSTNSDQLDEVIEGIDLEKDYVIKSKYLCNLGRLMYLDWYKNEKIFDPSKIERILKKSISLNNKDPFSHCWLGTYYKEVVKDYRLAEEEYRTAVECSGRSKHFIEKKHPLFENNLGLLFLDRVKYLNEDVSLLEEALVHLKEACLKNNDNGMGFVWADYNYDECKNLMRT